MLLDAFLFYLFYFNIITQKSYLISVIYFYLYNKNDDKLIKFGVRKRDSVNWACVLLFCCILLL